MEIHAPMDNFHRGQRFTRAFHLLSPELQFPNRRKSFILFRRWTRNIYMDCFPPLMSKRVVKRWCYRALHRYMRFGVSYIFRNGEKVRKRPFRSE